LDTEWKIGERKLRSGKLVLTFTLSSFLIAVSNYRANLEANRPLESEEEELIMNLSAAYLKKREEWKEEGKLEVAINLLREDFTIDLIVRATGLSIETIESLRDHV
jgi:hypothetical protein